ncbi:hypothetical protein ACT80S_17660 [Ramlibacter sp. MAHUQ-53]|uniref:hypothetical protein n=1 Tax=unclassified Ramlibacter TaxID=2617605 RepID=UPI00362D8EC7
MSLPSLRTRLVRWLRRLRDAARRWAGRMPLATEAPAPLPAGPLSPLPARGVDGAAGARSRPGVESVALRPAQALVRRAAGAPPVPLPLRLVRALRRVLDRIDPPARPAPARAGRLTLAPVAPVLRVGPSAAPARLPAPEPPEAVRSAATAPASQAPDPDPDPDQVAIDALFAEHAGDMPGLLAALRDHLARQDFAGQPHRLAPVVAAVTRDPGPMREGPTLFAFSALVEFLVRHADPAPVVREVLLTAIARCRPELAWSLMFELCAQLGGECMREGTRGALHAFLMDPGHPMSSATRAHMLDAFVKRAPMVIEDTPAP